MKEYDHIDAKLNSVMHKEKYEKSFSEILFIESFLISQRYFLVILDSYLVYIDVNDDQV